MNRPGQDLALFEKLRGYKNKYYLNLMLKGGILTTALVLSAFLAVSVLEYYGNFGTGVRAAFFYGFLTVAGVSLFVWVLRPLAGMLQLNRSLSDEEAAYQIGKRFPEIDDKLLNTLQLLSAAKQDALLQASVKQKASGFEHVRFSDAVSFKTNRKYLRYLLPPLLAFLLIVFLSAEIFTQGAPRVLYYSQEFEPQAPFRFMVMNEELKTFRDEDFQLKLGLQGEAVPQQVSVLTGDGRRLKMAREGEGFVYTFKKMQRDLRFVFEGAGFRSASHEIKVFSRPSLRKFSVYVDYPDYTGRQNERLDNIGNLVVPEGTRLTWSFQSQATESMRLRFGAESEPLEAESAGQDAFEFTRRAMESENYRVMLRNEHSDNKDVIEYYLNVVADEYPSVTLQPYRDTVFYSSLLLRGAIGDDYGLSAFKFRYRFSDPGEPAEGPYQTKELPFNPGALNQSYAEQVDLKEFGLEEGQEMEYYVEVFDNDAVNGRKSSKSGTFRFKKPSQREVNEEIESATARTQERMDKALEKAKEVSEEMRDLQNRLRGKRRMSWQDKQQMEQLLQKQQELSQEMEQLRQENEMLQQKQEQFNKVDKEMAEKFQQLQQLMDEVLDEETRELYEELEEMLEQNYMNQEMQDLLEKMEFDQRNVERDLERSIELFKKLKFDTKMQQIAEDLDRLAEEQQNLAEESEEAADGQEPSEEDPSEEGQEGQESEEGQEGERQDGPEQSQEGEEGEPQEGETPESQEGQQQQPQNEQSERLERKQEQLNDQFEGLQENMQELERMNEELRESNRQDLDEFGEDMERIEQQMRQSQQQLQQNQPQNASPKQQKASEMMRQMAQKMQEMQQTMEMQQTQENYDDLRQILENLVKLSFEQEDLMEEFKEINRVDPRFVSLSQKQLKLRDDAAIIKDSLTALSQRVFMIESFVTEEMANMDKYMDESVEALRRRIPQRAAGKQQLAMTSINELALLLNDILDQMQQQMSMSMSGQQNNEQQQQMPSLSQMQQQLNQQIQQLKQSGKSGRELAEELARLAAEQQRLRQALQKQGMGGENPLPQQGGKKPERGQQSGQGTESGQDMSRIMDQMEQTEEDLVNKRITEETIRRQREILTRLLESEKAQRERELDKKREAKTAERKERQNPPAFEEYIRLKEQQTELLKTVPAELNPYYKKVVNDYFRQLKR